MRQADHSQDWNKDAIIYELHVRAFQDDSGDGVGADRPALPPPARRGARGAGSIGPDRVSGMPGCPAVTIRL